MTFTINNIVRKLMNNVQLSFASQCVTSSEQRLECLITWPVPCSHTHSTVCIQSRNHIMRSNEAPVSTNCVKLGIHVTDDNVEATFVAVGVPQWVRIVSVGCIQGPHIPCGSTITEGVINVTTSWVDFSVFDRGNSASLGHEANHVLTLVTFLYLPFESLGAWITNIISRKCHCHILSKNSTRGHLTLCEIDINSRGTSTLLGHEWNFQGLSRRNIEDSVVEGGIAGVLEC
mmetsp:Transcript_12154/g.14445  ORF Transcript_12154/g.14445 Transcript_12154/m.14445 type:complete len:231 (+) Transcript_12154:163-855(+)